MKVLLSCWLDAFTAGFGLLEGSTAPSPVSQNMSGGLFCQKVFNLSQNNLLYHKNETVAQAIIEGTPYWLEPWIHRKAL